MINLDDEIPEDTIREMWQVISRTSKFPDDYVKAIEWGIGAMVDKKKNPARKETILNLLIGNLASHRADSWNMPIGTDETYYRMLARVDILVAWTTCIARAKSRDGRRHSWDKRGWKKLALWRLPKRNFDMWRAALKYKSPLLFAPAYLRKDEE